MPVEVQTRAEGDDFDGTAGQGLFSFAKLDAMPSTSRVLLASLGLRVKIPGAGGQGITGNVTILLVPQGGAADGIRYLMDFSDATEITNADGSADLVVPCDLTLPRELDGTTWDVRFFTTGKAGEGFAIVDWRAQPFPNASPEDAGT